MKNILKFKKCSVEELKDIWEKFGWLVFSKFEDYVVEVRKIESNLQAGWISQKELKAMNDELINVKQIQFD